MSSSENDFINKLTSREIEVLHLLSFGLSNNEMKQRLNICKPTLRSHLRSIYRKISINDRVKAVIFAINHMDVIAGYMDKTNKKNHLLR